MFENFENAVKIFLENPLPWLLFTAVLIIAGGLIPILGTLFLLPGALRETQRAIAASRAPEVGGLFDFSHFGHDAATMCLYAVSRAIGTLFCGVGLFVASIGFWYSAELSSELRVSPLDAMRISFSWVASHPGGTLTMVFLTLICQAIGGLIGGVGIFLSTPIVLIAWVLHWGSIRADVYELAARNGFSVAPPQL